MSGIAWLYGGLWLTSGGQLATGNGCCCGLCECAEYQNLCVEKVYSYYSFEWNNDTANGNSTPDDIPTTQPPGTLWVGTDAQGDYPAGGGCPGTTGIRQNHLNFNYCWMDDECNKVIGSTAYRTQWYLRYRVVADCADCANTVTYAQGTDITINCDGYDLYYEFTCPEGEEPLYCIPITRANCLASVYWPCVGPSGVDICVNEFP